jgi:hypothetical protein
MTISLVYYISVSVDQKMSLTLHDDKISVYISLSVYHDTDIYIYTYYIVM